LSTFAQLKNNVTLELGLDDEAGEDEDTLLGRRLNEGVRAVLVQTHCRVEVASTALTVGVADYELPVAALAMHRLVTNPDLRECVRENPATIHQLRESAATGAAGYAYSYALDGANLLMLYPTPAAADFLTLYYVPLPTEMVAVSDDPSALVYGGIPVQWHDAIELWAMSKLASYDDDSTSKNGADYMRDFELRITKIRLEIKKLGGRKQPRVRVNRRRYVSSDPSRT
jgi:hypothetical protein